MKFHICCVAKICFARLIGKEFLFFRLFEDLGIKTEVRFGLSYLSSPKSPASSFFPPPSQKHQAFSPGKRD